MGHLPLTARFSDTVQTSPRWVSGWFWEARTRVLLGYIALLAGLLAAAFPIMRHQVFADVNRRVLGDIAEELEAFDRLRSGEFVGPVSDVEDGPGALVNRMPIPDFEPSPKTMAEFRGLMDAFLQQRIPEDDTYLIAVVDGTFYKSSPRALPALLQPDLPLLGGLLKLRDRQNGVIESPSPELGPLIYEVVPVTVRESVDGGVRDRLLGTLLVIHATAGEREEAIDALDEVIRVLAVLTVAVLILGWWLSGRILAPLRTLTATAQQVSESDLSQRIPVRGVGELANLAQTFNDMMGRLEAAFQTQRHLLNDVGHELRTPITIIRGNLELMGGEDDPQEIEETRELLLDELDRMGRLVNELILLAKSERPDFLRCESFELSTWITELLTKVQALGNRAWQLDEVCAETFWGDRQRLTEALINLAENAVRHTQPDDIIALGCRQQGERMLLWVRDTGEGIHPVDQGRIFERFGRVAKHTRSLGSGLGLTIVRAIAEAHGGQVELVSEVGEGSQFTLNLPCKTPAPSVSPGAMPARLAK